MNWQWDEYEGDYRLDGRGSLDEIRDNPIPKKADFLLLNKIRTDLLMHMSLSSLIYRQDQFERAKAEITQCATKLIKAMELMPAAYEIEERKSNRPKTLRQWARRILWSAAHRL